LLWWIKDGPLPFPLVTTGNPNDPIPGALGQPGTQPLFGGQGLDYGTFSGLRISAGGWLNDDRTLGVEGSGFLLDRRSTGFSAGSDANGNPPLYNPRFAPEFNREGAVTISDPLLGLTGAQSIVSHTRLWGGELNGVANVLRQRGMTVNVLAGFRYADLAESLNINTTLVDPIGLVNDSANDHFGTRNQFYGGQVGTQFGLQFGRVAVDVVGKVALGVNHELVDINGSITESGPGSINPGTFPGGIFTQPSNISRSTHDQFAVLPEGQVRVRYRIIRNLEGFVGYNVLYWNQVVRPGSQIDRNLNLSQQLGNPLVGPALPAPQFNRTDFWAQGVTFGLKFRF
jgi:hypothetical protein